MLITSEAAYSTCVYNVSISRGLSTDADLRSLTLQLAGTGFEQSQTLELPNASSAVNGVIEWQARASRLTSA